MVLAQRAEDGGKQPPDGRRERGQPKFADHLSPLFLQC
jgi:hypothetical protein